MNHKTPQGSLIVLCVSDLLAGCQSYESIKPLVGSISSTLENWGRCGLNSGNQEDDNNNNNNNSNDPQEKQSLLESKLPVSSVEIPFLWAGMSHRMVLIPSQSPDSTTDSADNEHVRKIIVDKDAAVLASQGDFLDALDLVESNIVAEEMRTGRSEMGCRLVLSFLSNICALEYCRQGMYDASLKLLLRCMTQLNSQKRAWWKRAMRLATLNNIAHYYRCRKLYSAAYQYLQKAIRVGQGSAQKRYFPFEGASCTLLNAGAALGALGRTKEAADLTTRGITILEREGQLLANAQVIGLMGDATVNWVDAVSQELAIGYVNMGVSQTRRQKYVSAGGSFDLALNIASSTLSSNNPLHRYVVKMHKLTQVILPYFQEKFGNKKYNNNNGSNGVSQQASSAAAAGKVHGHEIEEEDLEEDNSGNNNNAELWFAPGLKPELESRRSRALREAKIYSQVSGTNEFDIEDDLINNNSKKTTNKNIDYYTGNNRDMMYEPTDILSWIEQEPSAPPPSTSTTPIQLSSSSSSYHHQYNLPAKSRSRPSSAVANRQATSSTPTTAATTTGKSIVLHHVTSLSTKPNSEEHNLMLAKAKMLRAPSASSTLSSSSSRPPSASSTRPSSASIHRPPLDRRPHSAMPRQQTTGQYHFSISENHGEAAAAAVMCEKHRPISANPQLQTPTKATSRIKEEQHQDVDDFVVNDNEEDDNSSDEFEAQWLSSATLHHQQQQQRQYLPSATSSSSSSSTTIMAPRIRPESARVSRSQYPPKPPTLSRPLSANQ